jgi:hypothetical protein
MRKRIHHYCCIACGWIFGAGHAMACPLPSRGETLMTNEAFFLACATIYAGYQSSDVYTKAAQGRNMARAIEDATDLLRRSDAAIKDMSAQGLKAAA